MEAQVRLIVSATQIHHNSIVVPRSRSLYCWRWRVSQQHMQNGLLLYHCNNRHASMPQCHVIRKFPILLLFYLATLSITTITWVCRSEQECDYGTLVEYWRIRQKMSVKQPHCPPKNCIRKALWSNQSFRDEIPGLYGTKIFSAVFTRTRQSALSCDKSSHLCLCFASGFQVTPLHRPSYSVLHEAQT
jgi:hypothetical protein